MRQDSVHQMPPLHPPSRQQPSWPNKTFSPCILCRLCKQDFFSLLQLSVRRPKHQKDCACTYVVHSKCEPTTSLKLQEEIREKETLLDNIQSRANEVDTKAGDLKVSLENLCESAKSEVDALQKAESELMTIEKDIHEAKREKDHNENCLQKIISDLKDQEDKYQVPSCSCCWKGCKCESVVMTMKQKIRFLKLHQLLCCRVEPDHFSPAVIHGNSQAFLLDAMSHDKN